MTPQQLEAELAASAAALETRLQLLGVATRKVPLKEWTLLPEHLQSLVPSWIPSLLANFSLYGSVLECDNKEERRTWQRYFCFWGPEEYAQQLSEEQGYCFKDEFAVALV